MWVCLDCLAKNQECRDIALEVVAYQDRDGDICLGDVCDKGHSCMNCGSYNVDWQEEHPCLSIA